MDNGASSYRRFLDGDEAAFDEIVKELLRSLTFFINGYVRDIHTAEDIAMDVFAELIAHKHRYNFKVSLKTYLFTLGRSRALNYVKRRNKLSFVELTEANGIEDRELEETVLAEEKKRVVNTAIAKLPENMREVIHLVYFEEMTYEEASRVMKIKRKKVDYLLQRAKKELIDILGEEGKELL